MQAPGMNYRATRVIMGAGDTPAIAYLPGDLVHESAVEGEHAWLVLGDDVEPVEGVVLEVPAKSASHAAWAAYAASVGKVTADDAEGMSRAALIKAVGSGA